MLQNPNNGQYVLEEKEVSVSMVKQWVRIMKKGNISKEQIGRGTGIGTSTIRKAFNKRRATPRTIDGIQKFLSNQ